MGSLSQPKNPLSVNTGVAVDSDMRLETLSNRAGVNQIRGVNISGSTGSGIPKPITDVKANVSNGSTGITCVVTVMYSRDPSDLSFGGVTILAKGYQGNSQAVQVGSGADSPVTFVLNNTGEALSLIVQPFGNSGSTPLASCPSVGVQLPKSTSGGAGPTTTTSSPAKSIALTVPAELSVAGSPISTAVGGTFAVTKATQAANKIYAGPASGAAAQPTFRLTQLADLNVAQYCEDGAKYNGNGTLISTLATWGGAAVTQSGTGTNTRIGQTANDGPMLQMGMTNTAATTAGGIGIDSASINSGIVRGILRRASCRVQHNQSTNIRYWIGFFPSSVGLGSTTVAADLPNTSVAAFRFSSTTDTTWKAVLATSNVAVTVVDTGVALDTTKSHLFEITWDGTNWNFFIDGTSVASFNTNTPANNTLLLYTIQCDNKNTANLANFNFAWFRQTTF